LNHLTNAQVEAAWHQFDKNHNGILDASEITAVADALLDRIIAERAAITGAATAIFNEVDAKNEIKAETVTTKIFESLAARKAALARELVARLDRNHDGRVCTLLSHMLAATASTSLVLLMLLSIG
jgi:hypothetical protein